MLQIHRWFILVGIVFIVIICLSVDLRLDKLDVVFSKWKQEFMQTAKLQGVSNTTLQAFDLLVQGPEKALLLKNDKSDKEKSFNDLQNNSLEKNVSLYVNNSITLKAQQYYEENLQILEKYGKDYNIKPEIIVALFAGGSNFGDILYKYMLVNVLATKSLLSKDKIFYERELISLLKLVDLGYVDLSVKGDEDGTFTYLGINPSVYLYYGLDKNKKGKVDLFFNKDDIYETAFYLVNSLELTNKNILGYHVKTNKNILDDKNIKRQRPLQDWQNQGMMKLNNSSFEEDLLDIKASFISLKDGYGVLLFDNFNKMLKINNNIPKTIAITLIADNLFEFNKQLVMKKDLVKEIISNEMKSTKKIIKNKKPKLDDIAIDKRFKNVGNLK